MTDHILVYATASTILNFIMVFYNMTLIRQLKFYGRKFQDHLDKMTFLEDAITLLEKSMNTDKKEEDK